MADDLDVNWDDDDMFDIDFDFDDDFDNIDPFKDQTFIGAAASGFLSGLYNNTVGSTDAILKTTRTILPKSWGTALDRIDYARSKGLDLVREFKEENYQSAKTLQSIAKGISEKVGDGAIKKAFVGFSEKDFSDWEKYSGTSNDGLPNRDDVTDDDVQGYMEGMVNRQRAMFGKTVDGINEMAAAVGGRISGGINAGNQQLVGIQSALHDILEYQRNVQARMDQAKLEVMTRTFLVNSKYYKFMESAQHAMMKELKQIKEYSGKSDFEKTSTFTSSKKYIRENILNTIGTRTGSLVSKLRENFGESGRKEKYNAFEDVLSSLDEVVNSGMSITPNMLANMLGGNLANGIINQIPYLINQGPFGKMLAKFNPEADGLYGKIGRGYEKLSDFGNTASYLSNNGLGLLNHYADEWEYLDEGKYDDYDDYKDDMERQGKKPMPKPLFMLYNPLTNQARAAANNMFGGLKSRGTRYTINRRTVDEVSKPGMWKEINNITLNDVLPGLLTRILTSLERTRTGNDSYEAPSYNYIRGQFISSTNNKKIVESDLFNHNEFSSAAGTVNTLVNKIDKDEVLTPEQRANFALTIMKDVDKEKGFNPYYYVNGVDGLDPETSAAIAKMISTRFNITDEQLTEYNNKSVIEQAKQAALSFKGQSGEDLNEIAGIAKSLEKNIPNISKAFSLLRSSGNEQVLRDLGIIYTKDGVDSINSDMKWERMLKYIRNPDDKSLKGDIDHFEDPVLPSLLNTLGDRSKASNQELIDSLKNTGLNIGDSLSKPLSEFSTLYIKKTDETIKAINDVGEVLFESLENLGAGFKKSGDLKKSINENYRAFSLPENFNGIPDHLDEMTRLISELVSDTDRKQTVLEQIAGCVCRTAGGWGGLSDEEKSKIVNEEETAKTGIFDKLRKLTKGGFDKGMEILMKNQPMILGGAIAGLGALAMHNPKAALLVAGTAAAIKAYNYIDNYAKTKNPEDDKDILDEDGNVILKSSKLANGEYQDSEGNIIQSWKDIKTALFDTVKGVWISVQTLSGKLFTNDNKEIVLEGLTKFKKTITKIWNKANIFGKAGDALKRMGRYYYQQDVYVKGENTPRLTRLKFSDNRYYGYDPNSGETYLITGFDEIKGPVYEIGFEGELNQVISEMEFNDGLVTSTGVNITKLTAFGIKAGSGLKELITKLGGKVKPGVDNLKDKLGSAKDKLTNAFSSQGIELRLDNIYNLLLTHFGYTEDQFSPNGYKDKTEPVDTVDEALDKIIPKSDEPTIEENNSEEPTIKPSKLSNYPTKLRLNSLAYKEEKSKEELQEEANRAIIETRDLTREIRDSENDETNNGDKKPTFLGRIKDFFLSKGGLLGTLTKMITNPVGWLAGSLVSSTALLAKMGWGLFSSVLGPRSPIYSMLGWGFTGMMWGIRKLLFSQTESFSEMLRLRRAGRRGRRRRNGRIRRGFGKAGKILMGLGLTYGAYKLQDKVMDGVNQGKSSINSLMNDASGYDSFYGGDEEFQHDDNGQEENPNYTDTALDALEYGTAGLTAYQYAKTAKKGYDRITGRTPPTPPPEGNPGWLSRMGDKAGAAASRVLSGSRAGEMALNVAKLGIKGGSKLIPIIGQVLMAMDAYDGFTDKEQLSDVFKSKTITGNQAAANGITNMLDLGGIVSGTVNTIADITGIEALRQEGGMTRALAKVMSALSKVPIFGTPFSLLESMNIDVSSPQAKIRCAQYGILKLDSQLARLIDVLENQLEQYVKYNKERAWIDDKAPIAKMLSSFPDVDPKEIGIWYKFRFEPIYLVYQAAIRSVGFDTIREYDKAKSPTVMKVINQVQGALTQIQPYPLDVMTHISDKIGIADRQNVEGRIREWKKEISDKDKEEGIDANGNMEVVTKINTESEDREKVNQGKKYDGFFGGIKNYLAKQEQDFNDARYQSPAEVKMIDISDLHKDGATDIDGLTMVRLNCYGNTDNSPWRVDAVLKLERYCESLMIISTYKSEFTGNPKGILELFRSSFRVSSYYDDIWLEWFNKRFLPVFKSWCFSVFSLRSILPFKGWRTLSATNKFKVANDISQVIFSDGKENKSIWDITESPFDGTKSGDDPEVNKKYLNNLESAAKTAQLKAPEKERAESAAIDKSKDTVISAEFAKKQAERINEMRERNTVNRGNTSSLGGTSFGSDNTNIPNATPPGPTTDVKQSDIDNGITGVKQKGKGKGISVGSKEGEQSIIKALAKRGITDPKAIAFTLANTNVESGNFKNSIENLNYRDPNRARSLFSALRGFTDQQIKALVSKGSAAVASVIYGTGKKARDLGNRTPQDGADFLGRGWMQLTGRGNFEAYQKDTSYDVLNHPELVSDNKDVASDSAAWFVTKRRAIDKLLATGSFEAATKIINSAGVDMGKRKALYQNYLNRIENGSLNINVDPNAPDSDSTPKIDGKVDSSNGTVSTEPKVDAGGQAVNPDIKTDINKLGKLDPINNVSNQNVSASNNTSKDKAYIGEPVKPEIAPVVPNVTEQPNQQPVATPSTKPSNNTASEMTQPPEPQVTKQVQEPKQKPATTPVTSSGEGPVEVVDRAVAGAINNLADSLGRLLSKQTTTPTKGVPTN